MSGPGVRPVNPKLERLKLKWDTNQELISLSASLDCVPAALVNEVQFLLDNEAAGSVQDWWLSS